MVLVILAVVWALYLASWLRSRAHGRRHSSNSIASFSKHLSVLERARPELAPSGLGSTPVLRPVPNPAAASTVTALASATRPSASLAAPQRATHRPARNTSSAMPRSKADAQRRRREVVAALIGLNLLTLAAATALGGVAYALLGASVVMLAGYLYLLAQMQTRAWERHEKVRFLHSDDDFYDEPLLVGHSAT